MTAYAFQRGYGRGSMLAVQNAVRLPDGTLEEACAQIVMHVIYVESVDLNSRPAHKPKIWSALTRNRERLGNTVLAETQGDEIEKAVAGSDSGLDSGVGANMLGLLLTYMQESKSPAFIVATSNNIDALPPELRRRGRFDEIFLVDLPHIDERKEVWKVHLRLVKRDPADFDIDTLADKTNGFTPAEIEACVADALIAAFADRQLTMQHLLDAVSSTVPLSESAAEKIKAIRDFARGRCRPASKPHMVEKENSSADVAANRFAAFKPGSN